MKKILFVCSLLLGSVLAKAQSSRIYTKHLQATQKIQLKNRIVTDFTIDMLSADSLSNTKIPTAKSVNDFVRSLINGGGGGSSPITIENGSSLFSTGLINSGNGSNAVESIIFGSGAGWSAINADFSLFLGANSGQYATNAFSSIFLGQGAGKDAAEANNSIFIGIASGFIAPNANNSIFIGRMAGFQDVVNNSSSEISSILIGNHTRTGGFQNSILLGSGVELSPISNTKANQFMLANSITNVKWRGVEYELPSSQGAAGTVLTNNGSGVLSWAAGGGGSTQIFNGEVNGLVGDSLTDNTATLQALINANNYIFVPAGIYRLNGTVTIPAGKSIFGAGNKTRFVTQVGDTMFILSGQNTLRDFSIEKAGSVTSGQVGVYWTNCIQNNLVNLFFKNIQGVAILAGINASSTQYGAGSYINACFGTGNTVGIKFLAEAEYINVIDGGFSYGGTGIEMIGGNNSITGGDYNYNSIGMRLTAGANHAHCGVSNAKFNHNDTALVATSITLGHKFSNCMFYYGVIYLNLARKINFDHCDFNFTIGNLKTLDADYSSFTNCRFEGTFTFTAVTSQSIIYFKDNFYASSNSLGTYEQNLNGGYLQIRINPVTVNAADSVSCAIASGGFVKYGMANQVNTEIQFAVDLLNTTGTNYFKNVGYGNGNVNANGTIVVTKTNDADNVYVKVVVTASDGTTVKQVRYVPGIKIGSNWHYSVDQVLPSDKNDRIYVRVINESANSASITSASIMTMEGL